MHSRLVASGLAAVLFVPLAVAAADPQAPPQQTAPPQSAEQQDAEARKKLEADIAKELGQKTAPTAPGQSPTQAQPVPGAQGTGGNPMARILLLPDISAIGSFAGAYDSYDVRALSPREGLFGPKGKPTPLFEELELGIQSVIDPYARADIFISFSPGGVDVEEGYLTSLNLPAGLQIRAGKFFSPFGRQNQQHPHIWDFVDAPLARGRIVAGEVLSGPGLDVAWLAPLPWFAELHLAGQGTALASPFAPPDSPEPEERLTGVARLLQYFPLGEATTLGLGVSAARRDEANGGGFRDLGCADLYLRWRPLQSRAYVALQSEVYTRKFRNVEDGRSDTGGYAQLFWRQDAYFGYGVRYDDAPMDPTVGTGREHRFGALGIWYPSEFQRLRLQVSYDRRPDRQDGVEALLALEFGIGAHGAHPF